MAQKTMIQAITDALDVELANDPKTLVFGEDVGKNGGVFRATDGLQAKYGEDRVFDTPLAESGIGGLSIGSDVTDALPDGRHSLNADHDSGAFWRWCSHPRNAQ